MALDPDCEREVPLPALSCSAVGSTVRSVHLFHQKFACP